MDIKKVYIDTIYKTVDRTSDSDFYVELPLSINMPDQCICYIDDIVLPVSWTMNDSRHDTLYFGYRIGEVFAQASITIPSGSYNGIAFIMR